MKHLFVISLLPHKLSWIAMSHQKKYDGLIRVMILELYIYILYMLPSFLWLAREPGFNQPSVFIAWHLAVFFGFGGYVGFHQGDFGLSCEFEEGQILTAQAPVDRANRPKNYLRACAKMGTVRHESQENSIIHSVRKFDHTASCNTGICFDQFRILQHLASRLLG